MMEENDDDLDTHICLACQTPIIGLENYVYHKRNDCTARRHKSNNTDSVSLRIISNASLYTTNVNMIGDSLTSQSGHLNDHHAGNVQNVAFVSEDQMALQLSGDQISTSMNVVTASSPICATAGSLHGTVSASYNIVDPNMVLDAMANSMQSATTSLTTSMGGNLNPSSQEIHGGQDIHTPSHELDSSTHTTSIMDFLSTLELQCRPNTASPGKQDPTVSDTLEPRVPEGLKLANLLNDLNFNSDSEDFDMPSDPEDLLNFTEEDYRELDVTGSASGKGKVQHGFKGHWKGKAKGKTEHNVTKYKKGGIPGKWRPGERSSDRPSSYGHSIGKRHYEEMSSDEDHANQDDEESTTTQQYAMSGGKTSSPCSHDGKLLAFKTQLESVPSTPDVGVRKSLRILKSKQHASRKSESESIETMEATAVNALLQIKSECVPDHTYDGEMAPLEGPDHSYDASVSGKTVMLLKCDPCDRVFKNTLALHSHMRSAAHKAISSGSEPIAAIEKMGDKEFHVECPGCKRSFNNKYNYARHLVSGLHLKRSKSSLLHLDPSFQRLLLPLKPFQCRICKFFCNSGDDLLDHLERDSHHASIKSLVGPMTCIRCKFVTSSPRQMYEHFESKAHLKTISESNRPCVLREVRNNLSCSHCNRTFHSATKLLQHCKVQHPGQEGCKGAPRKTYCEICDRSFSNHFNWCQHYKRKHMHREPGSLSCDVCKTKDFADQSYLDHHYKSQKHLDNVLKAATNNNGIMSDEDAASTQKRKGRPKGSKNKVKSQSEYLQRKTDGARLHKCKECNFSTTLYAELRPHYIAEHKKEVFDFNCEICGVGYDSELKLENHMMSKRHILYANEAKTGEGKVYDCLSCGRKCYSKERFSLHLLSHNHSTTSPQRGDRLAGVPAKLHHFVLGLPTSDKSSVQCPECKEHVRVASIIPHIRSQHGDRNEMPFKCHFCPKSFPSNACLYRHHKSHVGLKSFACKICPKGFRSQGELGTHELNYHKDELNVVPKLQCKICGEHFMQQTRLSVHMKKRHQEQRQWPCTWNGCYRQFIFKSELVMHMRVHTGERPFLCDHCGFSTKTKVQLRRHEKSHTGESNYKCKYCTFKASHSWGLRRHMRIHSGAKPYKCPHCSYASNCHTNLRHHIITSKRHQGLFLYHCKQCSFATNKGTDFQTHAINVHKVNTAAVENVAEYCGVYVPGEDCRDVLEGCQVLPVPERKTRVKREFVAQQYSDNNNQIANNDEIVNSEENIMDEALKLAADSYGVIPMDTGAISEHQYNANTESQISSHFQSHGIHYGEVEAVQSSVHHPNLPDHGYGYQNFHAKQEIIDDAIEQHVNGEEEVTHLTFNSELAQLIVPHMADMETGAVVELHMDGEFEMPISGENIQLIETDEKTVEFYYI